MDAAFGAGRQPPQAGRALARGPERGSLGTHRCTDTPAVGQGSQPRLPLRPGGGLGLVLALPPQRGREPVSRAAHAARRARAGTSARCRRGASPSRRLFSDFRRPESDIRVFTGFASHEPSPWLADGCFPLSSHGCLSVLTFSVYGGTDGVDAHPDGPRCRGKGFEGTQRSLSPRGSSLDSWVPLCRPPWELEQ